jgi:hypothetical protein
VQNAKIFHFCDFVACISLCKTSKSSIFVILRPALAWLKMQKIVFVAARPGLTQPAPPATCAEFRSGSAGLAEWSSTLLQRRCWEGPGFEPRVRDLGTNPGPRTRWAAGSRPRQSPLELAAAGAFFVILRPALACAEVRKSNIFVILRPALACGKCQNPPFLRFCAQH